MSQEENKNNGIEEYIERYANDGSDKSQQPSQNQQPSQQPNQQQSFNNYGTGDDLGYLNVDMSLLPLASFYPEGTQIKIRAAKVKEIQDYSVIDDRNRIDVTDKMNQLLASCIKYIKPDKSIGSYKDVKDGDRLYLIFQIRELTFQTGPVLSKNVECDNCGHEFSIIYRTTSNSQYPKTLYSYDFPEKLKKYYSKSEKCMVFNINDITYRLAPPTIGIQESFFDYLRSKIQADQSKNPNVSQMKLLQFLLWDRNYISEEGIKEKEQEIKKMDMKTFQILNSAVEKMQFGLKEARQKCSHCGTEVHSQITFPQGASSIFIVPDFFEEYDRQ